MEDPIRRRVQLVFTADGSPTLFVPEFNEHYHSKHGALNESQHVYIEHGLMELAKNTKEVSVLEVGFGTGLNALLTYRALQKEPALKINYHALEPFPLPPAIIESLAESGFLAGEEEEIFFRSIHRVKSGAKNNLGLDFLFVLEQKKLEAFETSQKFDLIYFDAFAPRVQPELWGEEIFLKLFSLLNSEGILISYCAQGAFKRNLKSAGFRVEVLPGPKGKREITRARKLG